MEFSTVPDYSRGMGGACYFISAGALALQSALVLSSPSTASSDQQLFSLSSFSWTGALLISGALLAFLSAVQPRSFSRRWARTVAFISAGLLMVAAIEDFAGLHVIEHPTDLSLAFRYAAVALAAVVVVACVPWLVLEAFRAQSTIKSLQAEVVNSRSRIEEVVASQALLTQSVAQSAVDLRNALDRGGRLGALVESSQEAIIGLNANGSVWHWNPAAEHLFSMSKDAALGASIGIVRCSPTGDLWQEVERLRRQPFLGGQSEVVVVGGDGTALPVWLSVSEMLGSAGEMSGYAVVARDMSEKRHVEERIARSLQEKVVLLREVHHRVKNNLQLICSLLRLQSKEVRDDVGLRIFRKSEERIRSLALVHERLYSSDNVSSIRFDEYLSELLPQVVRSALKEREGVKVLTDLHLEQVPLPVDTSIALGLIAHELLTNATRHARPAEGELVVSVHLKRVNGAVILSVLDNGLCESGVPVSGDNDRLGLTLVRTLARQLSGDLSFEYRNGTVCSVSIPVAAVEVGHHPGISRAA